jgi:hypothetical protein
MEFEMPDMQNASRASLERLFHEDRAYDMAAGPGAE